MSQIQYNLTSLKNLFSKKGFLIYGTKNLKVTKENLYALGVPKKCPLIWKLFNRLGSTQQAFRIGNILKIETVKITFF